MESESGAIWMEPGLRRITAPNPSPMTYRGTNSYILGQGRVALIDPGPDDPSHLRAILAALAPGETLAAILVTHSHRDHSGLAGRLSAATGAAVLAAGPSEWGRSPVMARLAAQGDLAGGEGVDKDFTPHRQITEATPIDGDWGRIDVVQTPGHMANHLSFAWQGALFTGDLVMGWSTSLVSPPDGDMGAFMASCRRLQARQDRVFHPGHGDPVTDPKARLEALIAHRKMRESQIIAGLSPHHAVTATDLAGQIYGDLDQKLRPAAARNVLAHLIDLEDRNLVKTDGPIHADACFRLP
jgi:glyoxylase-like metal-dependent hydrolase (beta-lactamase superfamily II)